MNDRPGYPWSEGDALFADELNAAIANAAGLSGTTSVRDHGATGDGITDDTASIRLAIGSGGKEVFFPAGTYRVSGLPIVLPSNTRITGAGREVAVIKPDGLTAYAWPGGADAPTVFAGYQYSVVGPFATTPSGGGYDTGIAIIDLGFDYTTQAANTASFIFVKSLDFAGLKFASASGASGGAVRCICCDRVTMRDCIGDNVMQMLDCWGGTTRVKISDVDVVMIPGGGNGGAFNLQGVGTVNDHGQSWQYQATNINICLNNGVAFFLDSQGDGSVTSDVLLTNVMIVATGGGINQAIVARGLGGRVKVQNMTCVAVAGAAWQTPITISDFYSYSAAETGANKVATTSGSNVITVTFAAGTDCGVGNYVAINAAAGGALVANGLSLSGPYKILSVTSRTGNLAAVVTCDARANATATGAIGASTSIIGYQGGFHDCELNGVTFDGAQAAAAPLVVMTGYGHQISNFNVTTNYGAGHASPQYSELFSTDVSQEPDVVRRPLAFSGVTAAPGAGPVRSGYSGDTVVSWNPGGPRPSLLSSVRISALAGLDFGAVIPASATDLSHALSFDSSNGINYLSPAVNYNAYGAHVFYVAGASVGYINAAGLNSIPIGQQTPAAGTFSVVQVQSTTGPTWTSGSAAPASTQPVGSIYSRLGGAVGATFYVSRGGGTWAAVAGV